MFKCWKLTFVHSLVYSWGICNIYIFKLSGHICMRKLHSYGVTVQTGIRLWLWLPLVPYVYGIFNWSWKKSTGSIEMSVIIKQKWLLLNMVGYQVNKPRFYYLLINHLPMYKHNLWLDFGKQFQKSHMEYGVYLCMY